MFRSAKRGCLDQRLFTKIHLVVSMVPRNTKTPFLNCFYQEGRNSLKKFFVGQDIPLDIRDPDDGNPGQKFYMQVACFCCFRHGVARDVGRDVPDLENVMQENIGLIFRSLKQPHSSTLSVTRKHDRTSAVPFFASAFDLCQFSFREEEKEPKPKLFSPDMPFNEPQGNQTFWRDIPGFCRISRKCPKV